MVIRHHKITYRLMQIRNGHSLKKFLRVSGEIEVSKLAGGEVDLIRIILISDYSWATICGCSMGSKIELLIKFSFLSWLHFFHFDEIRDFL